jgi:electron transport complex protein RnfG
MTDRSGRKILKSAAALGLVAVIGTTLLTGVSGLTSERIAAEERRVVQEQLGQILPQDRYDNSLPDDHFSFTAESYFPRGQSVTAYRARLGGQPVAVVLRFSAVNGYNGNINMLAGIEYDGTLAGVRVVSHKETPGLGDGIEAEKSDWVLGFVNKSLTDPAPPGWTVKNKGGDFDQFTGATVTPLAVIEAVKLALEYYAQNRAMLFETAAEAPGS